MSEQRPETTRPTDGHRTLQDYFFDWQATREVSEARKTADRSRFFTYIMPKFGKVRVDRIKSRDVQNWADAKKWPAHRIGETTSVEVGDATKYATLMVLRQVLDQPVRDGVIRSNPASSITTSGKTNTITAVDEFAVLTADQADRLVAATDPQYRALVLLGLRLGPTWSEAMGLRADDVDFPTHTLHVGRYLAVEVQGKVQTREGLAHEQRDLSMPADLEDALRAHLDATAPLRDAHEPWIFLTPTGKRPLRANWNRYTLRPALERAGLPVTGTTFHTFRHTAARAMLDSGCAAEQVQRTLGHRDVDTTRRLYRQFLDRRE